MSTHQSLHARRLVEFARDHPDAPALCDLENTWSFGELAAHAAGVAAQLAEMPNGSMVGLLTDRHLPSVASVFGALWAGRGWVVVDAREPHHRLADMFARAGVTAVVNATSSKLSHLGTFEVHPVRNAEPDRSRWIPVQLVDPGARCTVQFTSGSTGRAKGVVKRFETFSGIVGAFSEHTEFLAPNASAIFMPLHFAGGLDPILSGLAVGRFTVMVDPAALTAEHIIRRLRELRIEQLHATPSYVRSLLGGVGDGAGLPRLRNVWMTGEPVLWSDVHAIRARFGAQVMVASAYGATEALGARCIGVARPNEAIGEGRLPLGRPMFADAIRVDTTGHPDAVGELVYRGWLSDGYLDDPELNAKRYGVDPDGVRIWRSGDIVHLDPNGVLHARGRADDMVKINGQLVEPAETEAALRTVEGIRSAAVRVNESNAGRPQLVGHVEVSGPMEPAAIIAALRDRLPACLVPSRILVHDRLPLTDRGKVNGARLDELAAEARASASESMRRTGGLDFLLETVLTTARELIDDDLGPDDSIWDAGCDSLTAIQLLNDLAREDRESLDAAALLTVSTCRDLADCLRSQQRQRRSHVVVLNAEATRQPVVLVAGGGAFALGYRPLTNEIGDLHPIIIYEQSGLQSRDRRDPSVQAAAMRNLRDLRTRQPSGPYVIAGHSWGGAVAHEMVRQLEVEGEPARLVLLDAARYRPAPPEAIRDRRDSRLVWALKYAKWRIVRGGRAVSDALAFRQPPIGSLERYDLFYRHAVRTMKRLAIAPITSAVLLVHPTGSAHESEWDDHPNLRKVAVGGDHHSMLWYPHVIELADALRSVVAAVQPEAQANGG